MSANPTSRLVVAALGVGVLGLSLLTGCSDDSEDGSPVAQSTTTEASTTTEETSSGGSDCGDESSTGKLAIPTSSVDYATGTAAYSVTLSDGTTQCVTAETDSNAGQYSTDKEISIQFGDAAAGILITIDGETAGNVPSEVPHQVEDAFMALQVDGGYFADSFHSGCDVTLTSFDDETITGTFTCTDVALFDDGPFSSDTSTTVTPQPLDTSIEKAEGWFSVQV